MLCLVHSFVFLLCLDTAVTFCSESDPLQLCLPGEWLAWGQCEGRCDKQIKTRKRAICCDKFHRDPVSCLRSCNLNSTADTDTQPCRICEHGVNENEIHCRCHKGYSGHCCETAGVRVTSRRLPRTTGITPKRSKGQTKTLKRTTLTTAISFSTKEAKSAVGHAGISSTSSMKGVNPSLKVSSSGQMSQTSTLLHSYRADSATTQKGSRNFTANPREKNKGKIREAFIADAKAFWWPQFIGTGSLAIIFCTGFLIWKRKKRKILNNRSKRVDQSDRDESKHDLSYY